MFMKKSLVLTLSSILLLAGVTEIKAHRVWLLNLTNKPQNFSYLKQQPGVNNWKEYTFKDIPAQAKSNGHEISRRKVRFQTERTAKNIATEKKASQMIPGSGKVIFHENKERSGNWTIVVRKNGDIEYYPESVYESNKVKEIIRKELGNAPLDKIIKNW